MTVSYFQCSQYTTFLHSILSIPVRTKLKKLEVLEIMLSKDFIVLSLKVFNFFALLSDTITVTGCHELLTNASCLKDWVGHKKGARLTKHTVVC